MADMPKGDYEETLAIDAEPENVFAFVADVRNLPKYLPTTKSAKSTGEDRVEVNGSAAGHDYSAEGFLRADESAMRMEWGADEDYYSGWLQVRPADDGSEVTVHISMRGPTPGGRGEGPSPEDVREGLRKGLESIRNHCQGDGGKEEPAAAT